MAHMLEMVNGQAQMAYAETEGTPWHKLGVPVRNDMTPKQMMKAAGLDWQVEKQNVFLGNGTKLPNTQALVRTSDGKILDTVGENWNPVQNEEAFEFFSEYVLAGDMEMNTAGSLFDGKRIWALAKVKESFDILGGDQIDSYLLFSNPHKYGHAIDVRFTPIRVVCNNTLSMSLGSTAKNAVKLNHRSMFNPNLVKEQLGIANEKFSKYREIAEFLASKPFSVDAMIEFYSTVYPHSTNKAPKKVEEMSLPAKQCFEVLDTQPGHQYGQGTFWQLVNSLTYHVDHNHGRISDNRLDSAWFGANAKRKNEAMNTAIQLANAA